MDITTTPNGLSSYAKAPTEAAETILPAGARLSLASCRQPLVCDDNEQQRTKVLGDDVSSTKDACTFQIRPRFGTQGSIRQISDL